MVYKDVDPSTWSPPWRLHSCSRGTEHHRESARRSPASKASRKQAALSAGADTHPALLLRMTKEAQSPYWSIGGRQVTRAHGTFQGEQATNIAPPGYTTKPAMEWPSSLAITTALHVCVCSPHYTGSIRSVLIKQDNYNNTRKERRCVERNSPKVAKFGK